MLLVLAITNRSRPTVPGDIRRSLDIIVRVMIPVMHFAHEAVLPTITFLVTMPWFLTMHKALT